MDRRPAGLHWTNVVFKLLSFLCDGCALWKERFVEVLTIVGWRLSRGDTVYNHKPLLEWETFNPDSGTWTEHKIVEPHSTFSAGRLVSAARGSSCLGPSWHPQYTELSRCSVTILLLGLSLNSRNFSSLLIPLQILPNMKEITVVH